MNISRLNFDLDKHIQELLLDALKLCEKSTQRGDLVLPFVMVDHEIIAFPLDDYKECVQAAITFAQSKLHDSSHILLGYDGYITYNEKRTDAIFLKIFQKGYDRWLIFVQKYEPKTELTPYHRLGTLELIHTEPLTEGQKH